MSRRLLRRKSNRAGSCSRICMGERISSRAVAGVNRERNAVELSRNRCGDESHLCKGRKNRIHQLSTIHEQLRGLRFFERKNLVPYLTL